jgi:hypothetical protein
MDRICAIRRPSAKEFLAERLGHGRVSRPLQVASGPHGRPSRRTRTEDARSKRQRAGAMAWRRSMSQRTHSGRNAGHVRSFPKAAARRSNGRSRRRERRYPARVRLLVVLGCGAATAVALSCGGSPFTLAPAPADATVDDAPVEAALESGAVDGARKISDAGATDARDASDAGVPSDAGVARDEGVASDAQDAGVSDAAPPPHCASGFACVPSVPIGFAGPFELYPGPDASPSCGADFAGQMLSGNSALDASLPACGCACGPAQGVQCSAPTETFYDSVTCPVTPCATANLTPGACTPLSVCGALLTKSMILPPSTPSQGSCAPVATMDAGGFTWGNYARACATTAAPSQADCPVATVCAPIPASPFRLGLCVEQSGDIACPAAGYNTKRVFYAGVDDRRGCSPCSCDAGVTGASCTATVNQYNSTDGGCAGLPITYLPGASCQGIQQPADLRLTLMASGGSCAPSTSAPTGSATPAGPTTFCCLP